MLGEGAAREEKEDVDPAEDGKMSIPAGDGAGIETKDGEVKDGKEQVSWLRNSREKPKRCHDETAVSLVDTP